MTVYLGTDLIAGVTTTVDKSERIGQIIQSTIPLVDAGLHLLDGALIQGGGIYSDFVDYIADIYDASANYFCSEADWQTAVTTYGVCGKFVYDSVNNTVRLPKYSNKIYTLDISSTAPVVGNGKNLGLNNSISDFGLLSASSGALVGYTKFAGLSVGTNLSEVSGYQLVASNPSMGVSTEAAKSGIIADLANITTSLDGYYYIVIATTTKTNIQVDIDEIATDLNGKADVDLTNCTKPHVVETYVNGTSWYRVYSDGWCEQGGITTSTASTNSHGVSLLKTMQDSNYVVIVHYNANTAVISTDTNASQAVNRWNGTVCAKTTTSFTMQATANNGGAYSWYVTGYKGV